MNYHQLSNEEKHAVDSMILQRLVRCVVLVAVALALCAFLLARMDNTKPAGAQEIPPAVITTENTPDGECHEDMPCWDCSTMGNQVCGPVDIGTPLVIVAPAPAPAPVVAAPAFTG